MSTQQTEPRALAAEYDKLHIGCGDEIREGWCNLDALAYDGVNVVHDIRERWPFPDGSFERIEGEHVLEHITHERLEKQVFPEIARVLEPGGVAEFAVPIGADARADPTHRSRWGYRTPEFYSADSERWQPGHDLPLVLDGRELEMWSHIGGWWTDPMIETIVYYSPIGATTLPLCSGELRFTLRKQ